MAPIMVMSYEVIAHIGWVASSNWNLPSRHVRFGEDSEIPFQNVTAHATRFLQEVAQITDVEDTDND